MNTYPSPSGQTGNQAYVEEHLAKLWQAALLGSQAEPQQPAVPAETNLTAVANLLRQLAGEKQNAMQETQHVAIPQLMAPAQPASAFYSFPTPAPAPPQSNGMTHLETVNFWLQLYQTAKTGLERSLDEARAAMPALAPVLAALPGMPPAMVQPPAPPSLPQPLQGLRNTVNPQLASLLENIASTKQHAQAPPTGSLPLLRHNVGGFGDKGDDRSMDPDSVMGFGGKDWSLEPSDGPDGQYRKRQRKLPTEDGKICANCGTTSTPFWRKDRHTNQPLCNACGLYAAKNDHPRPVKLWREGMGPGGGSSRSHMPYSAPPSVPSNIPPMNMTSTPAGAGGSQRNDALDIAAATLSTLANVATASKDGQQSKPPNPVYSGPPAIPRPSSEVPLTTVAEVPDANGDGERVIVQVQDSAPTDIDPDTVASELAAALERATATATVPSVHQQHSHNNNVEDVEEAVVAEKGPTAMVVEQQQIDSPKISESAPAASS